MAPLARLPLNGAPQPFVTPLRVVQAMAAGRPVPPPSFGPCPVCGEPRYKQDRRSCGRKACHHALGAGKRPKKLGKRCLHCDVFFFSAHPRAGYCSKSCLDKAFRLRMKAKQAAQQEAEAVRVAALKRIREMPAGEPEPPWPIRSL